MISKETLSNLTHLARTCYNTKTAPDVFALRAAVLASTEVAGNNGSTIASFTTFNTLPLLINLTRVSAKISVLAMKEQGVYSENLDEVQDGRLQEVILTCETLVDSLEDIRFAREARALYDRLDGNKEALQAASLVFLHVYASTRTAYVLSSLKASSLPEEQRKEAFTHAMNSRMKSDLQADVLEPGFFMRVMSSPSTQQFALGAVVLSLIGMALAASFAPALLGASAGTLVAGASLYTGCFFMQRSRHAEQNRMTEKLSELNDASLALG